MRYFDIIGEFNISKLNPKFCKISRYTALLFANRHIMCRFVKDYFSNICPRSRTGRYEKMGVIAKFHAGQRRRVASFRTVGNYKHGGVLAYHKVCLISAHGYEVRTLRTSYHVLSAHHFHIFRCT